MTGSGIRVSILGMAQITLNQKKTKELKKAGFDDCIIWWWVKPVAYVFANRLTWVGWPILVVLLSFLLIWKW